MSASDLAKPSAASGALRILRLVLLRPLKRSFGVLKGSRLGLAGLTIVLIFAAIAILAPFISPYPRTYEAPESDRFVVSAYDHSISRNLTYHQPVMGPTTPLSTDRQGGMWLINYAREGFIFMDFLQHTLETNETPFDAGNLSIGFHISDLPVSPRPVPPLRAVYYIIPSVNSNGTSGLGRENGAIAFFASRDFYVIDPFSRSLLFWSRLNFDPVFTGEDPASAGNMLIAPMENSVGAISFPPTPGRDLGTYRYFYATDLNRTVVFEVTYVHSTDAKPTPSGQVVLDTNETLTVPPFVYYNQDGITRYEEYRSGPGQLILLPLANQTLEVRNVTGRLRAEVPLTLEGAPATVAGPIGYTRASAFPATLYVPLRSNSGTGIAYFDVGSLSVERESAFPEPQWIPVGTPTSYYSTPSRAVTMAFFDSTKGPAGTTVLVRFNQTGVEVRQFRTEFPGRAESFFEVQPLSRIFVVLADGGIVSLGTTFKSDASVVPQTFAIRPPDSAVWVGYAGALGGTLYGQTIQQELYGVWTDPPGGDTTVFQLLGTPQVPLPPGTYPSGNHYILGTDFRGSDIVTQLIWGAQVAFIVGGLAALFAVGLGTFVGLIAGYFGKLVDTLLMRTTDIFLVLPFLPIVLILASILRPSIWVIILVLGIVGWPGIARVIRAQVLTLKERPFVDAARVSGASDLRIIFYQIAPNVLPFSFLYMSLTVAGAIITEAALSFLGLGDASVISWGGMLSSVLTFGGALSAWWWLLPPGLAITLLSLGFYLLGRGFDEIINPRLRRR